jgi:hypothetical protein
MENTTSCSTMTNETLSLQSLSWNMLQQMRGREIKSKQICAFFRNNRRYPCRTIPFRDLQTPSTEVIMGLDATGDYIIGLDTRGGRTLELVQRGLPSARSTPSSPSSSEYYTGAPLMRRIPLPCPKAMDIDMEWLIATVPIEILLSGDVGVARIHTSHYHDLYHNNHTNGAEDSNDSSMVVFHLPTGRTASCQTLLVDTIPSRVLWKVSHVPVLRTASTSTPASALSCMMNENFENSSSSFTCHDEVAVARPRLSTIVSVAHMIVHDEGDGFRLTWVVANANVVNDETSPTTTETAVPVSASTSAMHHANFITYHTTLSSTPSSSSSPTWQEQNNNDETDVNAHENSSIIAAEAFLHMDLLLHDIRSRRPLVFFVPNNQGHARLRPPPFSYTLVSVNDTGRFLTLSLCFVNPPPSHQSVDHDVGRLSQQQIQRQSTISVIVRVDVIESSYQELEWAASSTSALTTNKTHTNTYAATATTTTTPSLSDGLDKYSQEFAFHRRMLELQIGPYSVTCRQLTKIKTATGFDIKVLLRARDSDPDVGIHDGVECNIVCGQEQRQRRRERLCWNDFWKLSTVEQYKRYGGSISMSTLYPDCLVLTNAAVRRGIPVDVLQCRSGKTVIVYDQ